jgi:sugar O-acyltransferase (sialic acid O-acetyltransferase NeuD family)
VKDVFVINAGGFGRNIVAAARAEWRHGVEWTVRGFLDSRSDLVVPGDLPILGDPFTYVVQPGQLFACALGDPQLRRRFAAPLLTQEAEFLCLMPTTHRAERVQIGQGCLFEHSVSLGADAVIGDFVILLSTCIIGYDVRIGSYSTVGSFVFIGGGAQIGENVVIHPHATILPGVKVGDGAVIGAGSVVVANVPAGVTVFGNPAKRFEFK